MRELVSLRKGDGLSQLTNISERAPLLVKAMGDDPPVVKKTLDDLINGTNPNDIAVRVALALPVRHGANGYDWSGDTTEGEAFIPAGDLSERRSALSRANGVSLRTISRWEDTGMNDLAKVLAETIYRNDLSRVDYLYVEVAEALATAEQGNLVDVVRAQRQMIRDAKDAILALEQANNRLVKFMGLDGD